MHCVHCGRQLFRDPAATVTTRNGALHWGPKCAAKAGLTAPPKPRILTLSASLSAKRRAAARKATGQADWIDNLNTPQPDLNGLEPRATP